MNGDFKDIMKFNEERTLLMVINEIAKVFDDLMSKCPENLFSTDKTPRLILMLLSFKDGMTQSELMKATHMKGSTVSVAINKLEELGLVRRVDNPADKRSYRIFLTEKGIIYNDGIESVLKEKDELSVKGIAPKDIKSAMNVLNTILDNLTNNLK
jgi:DNA-binding MarR family transcriptional regulator